MSFDVCPASDYVSQGFGCTDFQREWLAPWCPSKRYHSGIDLGHSSGGLWHQPVYATRPGQVVAVGTTGGDWGFSTYLGNQAVCLKTHDAYLLYGHLDVASVTVGQLVQAGAQIGLVGSRGNSTGPHLHYEARTDGARQNVWGNAAAVLDPRPYLNDLTGADASTEVIPTATLDDLDVLLHAVNEQTLKRMEDLIKAINEVTLLRMEGEIKAIQDALSKLQPGAAPPSYEGTVTLTPK